MQDKKTETHEQDAYVARIRRIHYHQLKA